MSTVKSIKGLYIDYGLSDKIKTEVKIGISFVEDKEYFIFFDPDNEIIHTISMGAGIALGDLIGGTEPVPGILSGDKIYDQITDVYETVIANIRSSKAKKIDTIVDNIASDFAPLITINLLNTQSFKNLLCLPLMAEVMSDVIRNGKNASFKKSEKVLRSLKKYRKPLQYFAEEVMLYSKNPDPRQAYINVDKDKIPSTVYSGTTKFVTLKSPSDERIYEAFIPDSFDDLISYMVSRYILNYHFYCCSNCKRYFAFVSDGVTKNCTRVLENPSYFKDIGKMCLDVGRLRSRNRELYSDKTQILFQRQYKATFARKKHGKISEDNFVKWSEQARTMRDKAISGDITYNDLEKWFKDNYLRE